MPKANPAQTLKDNYSRLMLVTDHVELREEATRLVRASAISPQNFRKFTVIIDKLTDLDSVRFYLTNYILAAAGQRVWERKLGEHDATRRDLPSLVQ